MNILQASYNPATSKPVGNDLSTLINLGNTCFMNVCIQILEHTVPLREFFFSEKYKESFPNAPETLKTLFVTSFYNLMKGLHEEDCIVQPISFRNILIKCVKHFEGFRQEDAHECLMFILQLLHEGLANPVPVEINSTEPNRNPVMAWANMLKHEKSSNILYWYYGQYESLKKCLRCNTVFPTYDAWNSLSLEFPNNSMQSTFKLTDLLANHIEPEPMQGNEQYMCERCNVKHDAVSQHFIWKCPPILIVQLKRFKARSKIENLVDFPFELDMQPYVSPNAKNDSMSMVYDLYAVVYHQGGLKGGHYYNSCRVTSTNGANATEEWHIFNDANRHQINTDRIVTPYAYVLFYKKRFHDNEPLPRDWTSW